MKKNAVWILWMGLEIGMPGTMDILLGDSYTDMQCRLKGEETF